MPVLQSKVPEFEGPCVPVWLNTNSVYNRVDRGVTGFFRSAPRRWWALGLRVRTGSEFHGIIRDRDVVEYSHRGD